MLSGNHVVQITLMSLLVSNIALAADAVELNLTGTITPGSCNVSLSDGGEVNYGDILFSTLNQTTETKLPEKGLDMNIRCGSPTTIGMKFINNQPNSANTSLNPTWSYGLGTDKHGTGIGNYAITLYRLFTVDGSSSYYTMRSADEVAWLWTSHYNNDMINYNAVALADHTYAWNTMSAGPVPGTVASVTQRLIIHPYIVPTNTLDSSAAVNFDGSATLEIRYL